MNKSHFTLLFAVFSFFAIIGILKAHRMNSESPLVFEVDNDLLKNAKITYRSSKSSCFSPVTSNFIECNKGTQTIQILIPENDFTSYMGTFLSKKSEKNISDYDWIEIVLNVHKPEESTETTLSLAEMLYHMFEKERHHNLLNQTCSSIKESLSVDTPKKLSFEFDISFQKTNDPKTEQAKESIEKHASHVKKIAKNQINKVKTTFKSAYESLQKGADMTKKNVAKKTEQLKDAAAKAKNQACDNASKATEKIESSAQSVWKKTKEFTVHAAHKTADAAQDATNVVSETAQSGWSAVKNTAHTAKEKVCDASEYIADSAESGWEKAKKSAQAAVKELKK